MLLLRILLLMYNLFYFINLGAIKNVQPKKKEESIITSNDEDKMKLKKDNNQRLFDKPIDELVNFIEGNKAINEKRAAKKARRREKKVIFLKF